VGRAPPAITAIQRLNGYPRPNARSVDFILGLEY